MPNQYSITEIPPSKQESLEQLGTKLKFWFTDDQDNQRTLFKEGRPGTGENWVEVIVAEICSLLDIPHAKYYFAKSEDDDGNTLEGTITPTFVPKNARLILGNELLSRLTKGYDEQKRYGLKEYKMRTVLALFKRSNINIPLEYDNPNMQSSFDVFISYILLDCLISNPDRHHENWGIILLNQNLYLTPTYDHASGLGCREPEHKKESRLTTKDSGHNVENFVKKAKTPFYDTKGMKLSTIETCELCSKLNEEATLYWLNKIDNLDISLVRNALDKIPEDLISDVSKDFAIKVLEENKKRLTRIREELEK